MFTRDIETAALIELAKTNYELAANMAGDLRHAGQSFALALLRGRGAINGDAAWAAFTLSGDNQDLISAYAAGHPLASEVIESDGGIDPEVKRVAVLRRQSYEFSGE